MCGLVAALLQKPSLPRPQLIKALQTLDHRGPDQRSAWFSQDRLLALGHVRLSIIGLGNGSQPISDESGDLRCVVNGELYGYEAQREQLRARGRRFATDSDSEVALHLYDELGCDFVHELRGEFAVVIADQRRGCLVAARDRFGIKPLFYAVHEGGVYFASEAKALTALGDRMEMAHSVEGRVPFLDHHVAEYAAGLPVHHKIRGLREKHVLREATRDVILPEIYDRQKHPFMSPPATDAGDELNTFCRDVLASRSVDAQPFFEPALVRGLMDRMADLPPADRAASEGAVLRVVSTCVLQERFGPGA